MDKFVQLNNAYRWEAFTKKELMSEARQNDESLVERQRLIKVSEEFMTSEAYDENKDKYETLMRAKVRAENFDADTRINLDDFEKVIESLSDQKKDDSAPAEEGKQEVSDQPKQEDSSDVKQIDTSVNGGANNDQKDGEAQKKTAEEEEAKRLTFIETDTFADPNEGFIKRVEVEEYDTEIIQRRGF